MYFVGNLEWLKCFFFLKRHFKYCCNLKKKHILLKECVRRNLSRPIRRAHRESFPPHFRKMIARRYVYRASDRRVMPGAVQRNVIGSSYDRRGIVVVHACDSVRVDYFFQFLLYYGQRDKGFSHSLLQVTVRNSNNLAIYFIHIVSNNYCWIVVYPIILSIHVQFLLENICFQFFYYSLENHLVQCHDHGWEISSKICDLNFFWFIS